MELTQPQKTAAKNFIAADQILAGHATNGAYQAIATALNADASPSFVVWKTSVTEDEILQNGFDWTRLDNLSVGLARVWDKIFSGKNAQEQRTLNPSKTNVRAGIEAVWVGSAPDLAVRAAVYVHCKRSASVLEKLFATGTGSTLSPGSMVFEGKLTADDVYNLLVTG